MKMIFTHLVAGLLGVSATVLVLNPFEISGEEKGRSAQALKVSVQSNDEDTDVEVPKQTIVPHIISDQDAAADLESTKNVDVALAAGIDEINIVQGSDLSKMLSDIDIGMLDGDEAGAILEDFNTWLKINDNPAKAVFDYLSSGLDDDAQHIMLYMIAFSDVEDFASDIVNELAIAGESDYETWESIMSVASIDTKYSREKLLTVLPTLSDSTLVSTSLRSMQPAQIPSQDRRHFLSNIVPYTNSSNNDIRSAAIETIGLWSARDYSHLVAHEIATGTPETIRSSIFASADGNMFSDDIKLSLISVRDNGSALLNLRIDAYNALSRFPLSTNEYDQNYLFYQTYIYPLEQLSSQG